MVLIKWQNYMDYDLCNPIPLKCVSRRHVRSAIGEIEGIYFTKLRTYLQQNAVIKCIFAMLKGLLIEVWCIIQTKNNSNANRVLKV